MKYDFLDQGYQKDRILSALERYIEQEDFKVRGLQHSVTLCPQELCQKLLLLLDDNDLLVFLYRLKDASKAQSPQSFINAFLLCDIKWHSLKQVLLANAIINQGNQLVKFYLESGRFNPPCNHADCNEKQQLDQWMNDNFHLQSPEDVQQEIVGHWIYRKHLLQQDDSLYACRFALLETFVIQFRLSTAYSQRESLEKIMDTEEVKYKVSTAAYIAHR